MAERFDIELKLDGTRLCVSLRDEGGWEVSGDSVDLQPLLTAALAALERTHVVLGRTHYDALIQDHQKLTAMIAASQEPKP